MNQWCHGLWKILFSGTVLDTQKQNIRKQNLTNFQQSLPQTLLKRIIKHCSCCFKQFHLSIQITRVHLQHLEFGNGRQGLAHARLLMINTSNMFCTFEEQSRQCLAKLPRLVLNSWLKRCSCHRFLSSWGRPLPPGLARACSFLLTCVVDWLSVGVYVARGSQMLLKQPWCGL